MGKIALPRWVIVVLVLTVLLLFGGGAWFYYAQERALRHEVEANLTAIAQLKVDQIIQWRAERIGDAAVIAENPFFLEALGRWLESPQPENTEQILIPFRSLQEHYHYDDVLLADTTGQVRLSLSGYVGPLHPDAAPAVTAALTERQPVLTDLHIGPGDPMPHIGAVAPLFADDSEGAEPLGAIILQSNARQFLFPLIQSWPTPSDSAETLLVRREGDEVLFLNDLRFQSSAALALRFPLTQADLPAAMAVQGQEGVVQGHDYRGVEVLAAIKSVPDLPWALVAKVDAAEALSTLRRELALILVLLLGSALAVLMGLATLWQRNAKAQYRDLYRAETRHRVTLMSVGDGVLSVDARGRVDLLNPVAETLTGWTQAEARGKPLSDVFRILNEQTRQPVEDPARRVLREGKVVGLANHTLLVARDGTERPIADSGAPIRDEKGEIIGVVLVFRDQTAERVAQRALRESQEFHEAIVACSPVALYAIDLEGNVLLWNASSERVLGWTAKEIMGQALPIVPPDKEEEFGKFRKQLATGQGFLGKEVVRKKKDGSLFTASLSTAPLYNGQGEMIGIMTALEDITARVRAEAQVTEQLDELRRWHGVTLGREERILELKGMVNQLLIQAGQPPRFPSVGEVGPSDVKE